MLATDNHPCLLDELKAGYNLIPSHMHSAIENYILHGFSPGGFLTAVLANDLMEAVGRADQINQQSLVGWCRFIYNHTPSTSHGSYEAVEKWLAQFHA